MTTNPHGEIGAGAVVVQEHKSYVTITKGMRGYFAVLMWWNEKDGGFWEPYQSGIGSYETVDAAEPEAETWANLEGVEYRRPKL